jgi:hypothetical protein
MKYLICCICYLYSAQCILQFSAVSLLCILYATTEFEVQYTICPLHATKTYVGAEF